MMMFLDRRLILLLLVPLPPWLPCCHTVFILHDNLLFLRTICIFIWSYFLECDTISFCLMLLNTGLFVMLIKRAFILPEDLFLGCSNAGLHCWHHCLLKGLSDINWSQGREWGFGCLDKQERLRGRDRQSLAVQRVEERVQQGSSLLNLEIFLWKVGDNLVLKWIVEVVELIEHPL